MAESGIYALAMSEGKTYNANSNTLIVKVDAANDVMGLYLKIVDYWQKILGNDPKSGNKFQEDENKASTAQAFANSVEQTEEGQAAQQPQNMANIIRSVTDIIGLLAYVAQAQQSQS